MTLPNGARIPVTLVQAQCNSTVAKIKADIDAGSQYYYCFITIPVRHPCTCGHCDPVRLITRPVMGVPGDGDTSPDGLWLREEKDWQAVIENGRMAKYLETNCPYPEEKLAYD